MITDPVPEPAPRTAHSSAPEKWAATVWALVVLASVARVVLLGGEKNQGAWPIYALAGQHWLASENLYPAAGYSCTAFPYSPLLGAFFAPFSLVEPPWDNAIFRAFQAFFYLGALAWWSRACLPTDWTSRQRAAVFLLIMPLVATSLLNAQAGVLICGTVLLAVAAAQREHWHLAAACALLAASVKIYPVALVLLMLCAFPRRLALPALVAVVLVVGLPFALQRPAYVLSQYQDWPRLLASAQQHEGYQSLYNCDLRTLYRAVGCDVSTLAYRMQEAVMAVSLAVVCWAVKRASGPRPELLNLVLGLATCWMTVFGPATESFGYALLGPTLAACLVQANASPGRQSFRRGLLLASWLIFAFATIAVWFPFGKTFHRLGPHPLAGLLLFGVLLHDCWARCAAHRSTPGTSPGASWPRTPVYQRIGACQASLS
jgi:hypothetical protein